LAWAVDVVPTIVEAARIKAPETVANARWFRGAFSWFHLRR